MAGMCPAGMQGLAQPLPPLPPRCRRRRRTGTGPRKDSSRTGHHSGGSTQLHGPRSRCRTPLLGGGPPEGGRRSWLHLLAVAVAAAGVAALLLLLLRPARYLMSAPGGPAAKEMVEWETGRKPIVQGEPPFCRKSASIAVLSGEDNNLQLLIWSGIGAWGWVAGEAAAGASLAGGMADKPPAGVAEFLGSSIPLPWQRYPTRLGAGIAPTPPSSHPPQACTSPCLTICTDWTWRSCGGRLRTPAASAPGAAAGRRAMRRCGRGGGVVWHWCSLVLPKCTLCQARQPCASSSSSGSS